MEYKGKEQHGYWWLHVNGTLQYEVFSTDPTYLKYLPAVKVWKVKCELDWYRMIKEYHIHREGPLPDVVA